MYFYSIYLRIGNIKTPNEPTISAKRNMLDIVRIVDARSSYKCCKVMFSIGQAPA